MPPFVLLTISVDAVCSMRRQSLVILRQLCSADPSLLRIAETKSVVWHLTDNSNWTTSPARTPFDTKWRRCRRTDMVHSVTRPKRRCAIFVNCCRAMPWISQKRDTIWERRQRGDIPIEDMALDTNGVSQQVSLGSEPNERISSASATGSSAPANLPAWIRGPVQ